MINITNINPKIFAQYDHQIRDNQNTKEELNKPGYDVVTEQTKDKELLKLKKGLKSGKCYMIVFSFKNCSPLHWSIIIENLWYIYISFPLLIAHVI